MSYYRSIFSLLGNLHSVLHIIYTNIHSYQWCIRVPFSSQPYQLWRGVFWLFVCLFICIFFILGFQPLYYSEMISNGPENLSVSSYFFL